jgi:hypothetical protein
MPRTKGIPAYSLYKPTGQARVRAASRPATRVDGGAGRSILGQPKRCRAT